MKKVISIILSMFVLASLMIIPAFAATKTIEGREYQVFEAEDYITSVYGKEDKAKTGFWANLKVPYGSDNGVDKGASGGHTVERFWTANTQVPGGSDTFERSCSIDFTVNASAAGNYTVKVYGYTNDAHPGLLVVNGANIEFEYVLGGARNGTDDIEPYTGKGDIEGTLFPEIMSIDVPLKSGENKLSLVAVVDSINESVVPDVIYVSKEVASEKTAVPSSSKTTSPSAVNTANPSSGSASSQSIQKTSTPVASDSQSVSDGNNKKNNSQYLLFIGLTCAVIAVGAAAFIIIKKQRPQK